MSTNGSKIWPTLMIRIDRASRRKRQSSKQATVIFNLVKVVDRKLIFKKCNRERNLMSSEMRSLNSTSINWSHNDKINANVLEIIFESLTTPAIVKLIWRCVICLQRRRTIRLSSISNKKERKFFSKRMKNIDEHTCEILMENFVLNFSKW